ncbi:MAG: TIGR00282 family metallophosphoesterase [Candidatus Eisenbacteria bacterium]|uniref:TIGR00282 family metallophosphoesterase n=1 Tax=Eiseniibacteriota bacterium TaxID=2212470 RepID=A0A538T2S1_UNCEI|nr:MAG: TIGR00282 family metallophosphoesterase [Candidatus Eisenbacteria bacterium]
MNILFIADIFGSPGRRAVRDLLPELVSSMGIDFLVANVENAAAGFGVTKDILEELKSLGVQCMTSGNHIWDRREVLPILDQEPLLLRPHNYPPGVPGTGARLFRTHGGVPVGVLNLMGRVFMNDIECPFRVADREIAAMQDQAKVIFVDFHAEATAEKIALGWHLDGRVSAIVGTHTHVQTADERIFPNGTGYITDAGMTGPHESVIGVQKELAIRKFLTQLPTRFEPATGDVKLHGVHLDVDEETGHCRHIERVSMNLDSTGRSGVS